jgi:16S rRNA (cytidine1402-2'-O)-methyltransferase
MSKLYIVPTPIGNLNDMTFRAIEILKTVDLILCEDTRKTSILLKHFEISAKLKSHHKFNEHKTSHDIINEIKGGTQIALVSDAGTPGISDPGFFLVRECIENDIEVETLPGASALIPALVNSGLASDKFVFEGFLPPKKGRQKRLKLLSEETRTMIFYESPHRLIKALEQFSEFFGSERKASVSRELSKMFEENKRGTIQEILEHFKAKQIKGEIVIVVEGNTAEKPKKNKKNKNAEPEI